MASARTVKRSFDIESPNISASVMAKHDDARQLLHEKIATFNINNVNRRLPNLLRWLRAAKPASSVCRN